jgi:hypothetical protein
MAINREPFQLADELLPRLLVVVVPVLLLVLVPPRVGMQSIGENRSGVRWYSLAHPRRGAAQRQLWHIASICRHLPPPPPPPDLPHARLTTHLLLKSDSWQAVTG